MFSLRVVEPRDDAWITTEASDPEIQRWTAHAGDVHNNRSTWVIQKSTDPVGLISLHSIDEHTKTADIGYWILASARRQGAAKAALLLLEQELATYPEVRSIQLSIMVGNEPSISLAKTMKYEEKSTGTCTCGTQGEVTAVIFEKTL